MKTNQLAYSFLCVLLILVLQGCRQGKNTTTTAIPPVVTPTNNLVNNTNDPVKKFSETEAKAGAGDAEAQFQIGFDYYVGQGVPQNYAEAVKWFQKAAEQGIAEAQYNLGSCYYDGNGVPQDYAEAVTWFRKAAEQGFAKAQCGLGYCYDSGNGTAQDSIEAAKWYLKAAEQGEVQAQYNLGRCYLEGRGVPIDVVKAVKWFREAAEQGDAVSQFFLGVIYRSGEGIPQNYKEAAKWHQKAAEQGLADAQVELGKLYSSGFGVPQDYQKAAELSRKAAEQGNADAQSVLGDCYWEGRGVPKDFIEAYKWFNLASAQGNKLAKNALSDVEREMTAEQIAKAQQLAREFKPRKPPESGSSATSNGIFNSSPAASGTGFFVTDDGFFVTCAHVVKGATQVRLVASTGFISAKVVQVDAANDLALLKADGRFAPLPIAASHTVALGGTVATVGFPDIGLQGFAPKLAKGEIASLSGAGDDPRYFQISVPVQPGNSGGALVDERGNVIGIVSAKLDASAALAASGALPENVNYAVKSSFLLSFLESVPEVSAKLKAPNTKDEKFEEVVKSAQDAAVLVLVY